MKHELIPFLNMQMPLFPPDKAVQAFSHHKLIRIKTRNDQLLEPGYIIIMYGDIAFRIKPRHTDHESQFIRMQDVADIFFEEN